MVFRLSILKQRKWRLEAFGLHWAISMFANFYQPQMAALFQDASPLEFGIGYRWRKNESNFVLAQKRLIAYWR